MILQLAACLWITDEQQAERLAAGDGAYTVTVQWWEAANQRPFAAAGGASVRAVGPSGTVTQEELELSSLYSGYPRTSEATIDVVFEENVADWRLELVLHGADDDIAVGRARVEALSEDAGLARMLLAEVDEVAWLTPLADPRWAGALAAAGDGVFVLAGGVHKSSGQVTDEVSRLRLQGSGSLGEFGAWGSLPEDVGDDGGVETDRAGFALHALVDDTALLAVGGCPREATLGRGQPPGSQAWRLSLDSGGWGEGGRLGEPRCMAASAADRIGNVVIAGGYAADQGIVQNRTTVESWSPATGEFDVRGSHEGSLDAAMAPFDTGVLLCGGASTAGTYWQDTVATDACTLVTTGGVATFQSLPAPRALHAMVALPEGRALVLGGVDPRGDGELADASATTWLVDEAWWWVEAGALGQARAGHAAAVLAYDRVLVAGGATRAGPALTAPDPSSCVEFFNPETGTAENPYACDEDDDAGALSHRAYQPMVAVDPEYGALVVGGLAGDEPQAGVHFVPVPP